MSRLAALKTEKKSYFPVPGETDMNAPDDEDDGMDCLDEEVSSDLALLFFIISIIWLCIVFKKKLQVISSTNII